MSLNKEKEEYTCQRCKGKFGEGSCCSLGNQGCVACWDCVCPDCHHCKDIHCHCDSDEEESDNSSN